MPEALQLFVAMGDALDGQDGTFNSSHSLIEAIVGIPPPFNSPAAGAEYFFDRTVELLDRVQLCLMLSDPNAVERLAPA